MTEICVGTGPCGELRYPAYQEKGGKWSYFGAQHPPSFLPACSGRPESDIQS